MAAINKKLDRFTATILAEATAETERAITALKQKKTEELSAAEDRILLETYNYIHGEVSRIKAEAGRRISARMLENKRAVCLRRDEIAREVFDAVREKIAAYTADPAYADRLRALLQEALHVLTGAEDVRVYLRPADRLHAAALAASAPELHLTFLDGTFSLGGLVAESPSLGLRCDSSFDSALEALEGHFAELFGLSLSDVSDAQ